MDAIDDVRLNGAFKARRRSWTLRALPAECGMMARPAQGRRAPGSPRSLPLPAGFVALSRAPPPTLFPHRPSFIWYARALTGQDSTCIIHVSNSMCMQKEEIESDRNRQRLRKPNLPHLRELEQPRGRLRELEGRLPYLRELEPHRPHLRESCPARDKESADSGRACPPVSQRTEIRELRS